MFVTPQCDDGWIETVRKKGGGLFEIDVVFPASDGFLALTHGRDDEVVFAARSRLARLGINVTPHAGITRDGGQVGLTADVQAVVRAYGVADLLEQLLRPGLPVGRLVFCPRENRLSSDQVLAALEQNDFQLPKDYSLDADGRFRIRPRGHVYDLQQELSLEDLITIAVRADGKDMLNRMQIRRSVDQIVLAPRDGIITSCSMFLHRHYVVLDASERKLGQHLDAVVLDPVTTRGTNVFLEFVNNSDHRIVNPTASAEIYRAVEVTSPLRRWHGLPAPLQDAPKDEKGEALHEYAALAGAFDTVEEEAQSFRYSHRTVALFESPEDVVAGKAPLKVWHRPAEHEAARPLLDVSSRLRDGLELASFREHGTSLLRDVPDDAGLTLLLGYFPNLREHLEICAAGLEGKIKRVIFRRASFEHGQFLSARDHGRLADYEGLGIDVFWCNDARKHVVRHVFRGLRGYFTEPRNVERFRTSLIFAGYGSSKPLPPNDLDQMKELIVHLRHFFGPDIAIMTGGGPGAMQQATDVAHDLDMLVGASFIETVDQTTNQSANFYQTFQGRSRQARQRWFEIASFHVFFSGGVGTLEEVGLTLTDMKLGVIELSPLVFFGGRENAPYWDDLRRQFDVMREQKRAPDWLRTHVLMTDKAAEVPAFYRQVLELG